MTTKAIRKKLVIVGDATCGKNSLLIVFSKDQFPEAYVPTVFENYVVDIEMDSTRVIIVYFILGKINALGSRAFLFALLQKDQKCLAV